MDADCLCLCCLQGFLLQFACKFCMIASFSCGIAAVALIWAIKTYDVKQFGGGLAQSKDMGVLFRYIHDLGAQAKTAVSG